MDYELFKSYILEHIGEEMSHLEEPMIAIHSVLKNNGIRLDALQIVEKGCNCSPNIYLNGIFDEYMGGMPIGVCLKQIAKTYENAALEMDMEMEKINDYDNMKDKIIIRLLNQKKNEELLRDVPYIPLLDFAISFRWMAHEDEDGIASALVTNKELEQWEITKEELYENAIINTEKFFPYSFDSMDMIMRYIKPVAKSDEEMEAFRESNLYVLSNKKGINGATSMLYEGVLKFFAQEFEDDFYILPSSVHEVILLPMNKCADPGCLYRIVKEANEMVVPAADFLSDKVYLYQRNTDQLLIVEENER